MTKKLGKTTSLVTISISTNFFGHTQRETISTRNNIAINHHLSLNALNCVIIATKTYLCLYVSILRNDLESSRMCLWNKIPIPHFGARSHVNHPCTWSFRSNYAYHYAYLWFMVLGLWFIIPNTNANFNTALTQTRNKELNSHRCIFLSRRLPF